MTAPDYFEFFGLQPKLELDASDLESRFYRLSRELHPDRHQRATPAERDRALESSAILNDAYRTLRDTVARAEYLLARQGLKPSSKTPPELLQEVFALNEALEEYRSGNSVARAQLEAEGARLRSALEESSRRLLALFREYDGGGGVAVLRAIRAELDRRKFIQNLFLQVEREVAP